MKVHLSNTHPTKKPPYYCIIFTCSAGIPDFRGPQGVWTLRDRGKLLTKIVFSVFCVIVYLKLLFNAHGKYLVASRGLALF
jgi:hypothetical protein